VLNILVEHWGEEGVVERGVTETALKPSLASIGVVDVAFGHLVGRRDEPAEAIVEAPRQEDLEDDDGDGGRCAVRSSRSAVGSSRRRACATYSAMA
jgi:hypothetical protein